MNNNYITLFREIAHNCEILSEQVMELDKKNNDEKGLNTATIMRDDYAKLYNRLKTEDFDPSTLTRDDYLKILAATYITMNNLEDKIQVLQKAVSGYKVDILPKLQRVVEETKTDEEVRELVEKIFQ